MPTFTVRCTEIENTKYNNVLKEVSEMYPDKIHKQSDALNIIFETFKDRIPIGFEKELPPEIDHVMRVVNCPHLKHDLIEGFQCYELFYKSKKWKSLGSNAISVIEDCEHCKIGKEDIKQQLLNKMFMRKQVTNILDLRDIFINLQKEGGIAQIYICKSKLFEKHTIQLSRDGINLMCSMNNNKEVIVKEHCYNAIDPSTLKPPCQYLIDPFIKVQIKPTDEAIRIIKEMQAIEDKTETEIKKPIEVESTIIDNETEKEN